MAIMKKFNWNLLITLFVVGIIVISAVFFAFYFARAKCECFRNFVDSNGIGADVITAYFTALAFVGFLIVSIYQAHSSAQADQKLEKEKKRNRSLNQAYQWLFVQTARLHSFSSAEEKVNRDKARIELEQKWADISKLFTEED
jgi:succinate dehydrogenase hydrophobic anchor subunit